MDRVIPFHIGTKQALLLLFLGISLGLSIQHLHFYVPFNFELLASLVLAPFILYFQKPQRFSLRFGWLSLIFFVLYGIIHLESTYYFGCCFLLLFTIETIFGKLNKAAFFLILVSSPLATYLFKVFGFPIRLQITDWSVHILSMIGFAATSSGNSISMGGEEFFVESACAGLKMSSLALVLCLAIITHFERQYKKTMSFAQLILFLGITLALVIVSNLFRVIFLILFQTPEDTIAHEMIGLICLGTYCILPLIFIIKYIIRRNKKKATDKLKSRPIHSFLLTFICLGQLLFLGNYFIHSDYNLPKSTPAALQEINIPGFETSVENFGGVKLSNEESLVYFKPLDRFWGADHNPLVCWKGSGYQLKKEKEIEIENVKVFFAELHKGEDVLQTAWWFDNGEMQTTRQLEWRMEAMRGAADFKLINVTCETEELLREYVALLIR